METKQSRPQEVGSTGAPQGSILAGFLFVIFQGDFPENNVDSGDSVLFVDDDTDNVRDANPDVLEEKLQSQADRSTEWVRDNDMVCADDKTKLLVIGTRELRRSRLTTNNREITVNVCGEVIEESRDEKLLGVIVSNNFTWKTHLYGNNKTGDDKIVGLTTKLSQRTLI